MCLSFECVFRANRWFLSVLSGRGGRLGNRCFLVEQEIFRQENCAAVLTLDSYSGDLEVSGMYHFLAQIKVFRSQTFS